MKRALLTVAILASAIGVASASIPGTSNQSGTSVRVRQAVIASPVPQPQGPASLPRPIEARHAPVPLLMAARIPVTLRSPDEADAPIPAAVARPEGESAARAAIEADGYKGVRSLRQIHEGVWKAQALRGTTLVQLTVDASGSVSLD